MCYWPLMAMPIEKWSKGVSSQDFLALLIVDHPLWDQHFQIVASSM